MTRVFLLSCFLGLIVSHGAAIAQDSSATSDAGAVGQCETTDCVLTYPRSFFDQYSPITALDVVRNTPGFQIDEGDQSRGFAGAAGNVLINSERPSAKSETASDILARLPADSVFEVQLIRGQAGGLDLRGQSVAVNVILVAGNQQSTTYEVGSSVRTVDTSEIFGFLSASHTRTNDWLDLTLGLELDRGGFQGNHVEQLLGPSDELLELRTERYQEAGWRYKFSLNGKARLGEYTASLNAAYGDRDRLGGEVSQRNPVGPTPAFFLLQPRDQSNSNLEIGGDIERAFGENWSVKLLGLYREEKFKEIGGLARGLTEESANLETSSDFDQLTTETITRIETDYSGFKNHILEFSVEGAINTLKSNFELGVAPSPGAPLELVPVPGAETRIEEKRGDVTLSDSWTLDKVVIDTTLAAETSTIEQSGDLANKRTFNFFKPSLAVSYSPSNKWQLRSRAERLVGQLDFGDFASSTDLGDDELALGNPDLSPDTRWRFSVASEWRFGGLGSLTVTGFHEEISNVVDVLLAGPGLEATGNIGNAVRTGVELEGTIPLGGLGIKGGRIDFSANAQESSVTDPVSGLKRRLSRQRAWETVTEFRQDFNESKISWGGILELASWSPFFGVDEFDRNRRQIDLDLFVEATRFGGLRFRIDIGNVFSNGRVRDRRVFDGLRSSDPILFREFRKRRFGRRFGISVRGNF